MPFKLLFYHSLAKDSGYIILSYLFIICFHMSFGKFSVVLNINHAVQLDLRTKRIPQIRKTYFHHPTLFLQEDSTSKMGE